MTPADIERAEGPSRELDTEEATFELYEVERDYPPLMVASATGPREQAWAEILHYAAVYSQDGPVEIKEADDATD